MVMAPFPAGIDEGWKPVQKNVVISYDWLPLISAQAAELVTAAMRGHENWRLWGLSASYLSLKANKIISKAIATEFCSRQSFHGAFFPAELLYLTEFFSLRLLLSEQSSVYVLPRWKTQTV